MNKKGADQTAWMRRLVCAYVVPNPTKTGFLATRPLIWYSFTQEMEEEVNIHYKELVKEKSRDQLLTNQLQRLAMCFDVYLETETVNTAREGPVEISREKVFTRVARYIMYILDSFHSKFIIRKLF